MKGKNVIRINRETMLELIQHYLTTVLFAAGKAPTVVAVTEDMDCPQKEQWFIVEVESNQPEETK